jgi:long-chain acyl-CoA synthetase
MLQREREDSRPATGWTLRDLVTELKAAGGRPAVMTVAGGTVAAWSAAEIGGRAEKLARGLLRRGVRPGESVALIAPNGPEWVVARLALGAMGAVAVALDDLHGEQDIANVLRDSGARRVFTAHKHVPALERLGFARDDGLFVIDGEGGGPFAWDRLFVDSTDPLPPLDPAAPAMLVYTSGTTAAPKAFALSSRELVANLEAVLAERLIGAGDRALLPLPLHHVYPFLIGLICPLAAGGAVVFPEGVTGPQIMQALQKAQVSMIVGVPRLYSALWSGLQAKVAARGAAARVAFHGLRRLSLLLLRLDIHAGRRLFGAVHRNLGGALRLLVCGGARLEPEVIWQLEALGFRVCNGYGLAETASTFTGNRPGDRRIGSEGRVLLPDSRIRIAEPNAEGIGEIQLKGRSVFQGYRNNPEANAAAFAADGWFRTGDLGRLDADGYVYVTGRSKEMIVLGGGKNIFPEELEKVYGASPFIRELAVLERQGALVALVLPDFAAIQASANTRVEDVVRVALASAARGLPGYQQLAGSAIVREALPKTRLGKFQRFRLPEIYERARQGLAPVSAEPSGEDLALLAQSPAREAWDVLKARYAGKPVAMDANLQLDLGIDSLEWVSLSLELEDRFGLSLTEDALALLVTVRDLLNAVVAGTRAPVEAAAPRALTAEQQEWLKAPPAGIAMAGRLLHGLNALLFRLLFGLSAKGRGNLPTRGPCIVIANHVSDLDPPALAAALPAPLRRRLYWSGDVGRLFGSRLARLFCRAAHIFPVDERQPAQTLAMAKAALARGHILVWFPESWRSPDGRLQRFLPGIGHILKDAPVPVVPAVIAGTFEALPRHRRLPRLHKVVIAFGPPLDPADAAPADATPADIAERLRAAVAALAGSETALARVPPDRDYAQ